MSSSVEQKVVKIIADQLGIEPEKITRETNIANDLGADSLDIAELMIAFEEAFDIDIKEEDAQQIENVGQVIDHVQSVVDGK
ncbi:MAG: acyl carrier protein [Thermoguttaceae bacterium]